MLLIDNHEPDLIRRLVSQSVPTAVQGLNQQGFADYLWFCIDGHRVQVERKQIDEVLSGMDQVEEQLRRELSNGVEETLLLIERYCSPVPSVKYEVQSWKRSKDGKIMVPWHKYNTSYSGLQAWKSQLDKAGITVVETFDDTATAYTLVALYHNSQKLEHTTLRRYIKDRLTITPYNNHTLTLMGIKGVNLGEQRAKALVDRFGTVWYILNQSAEVLAETLVGDEDGKQKRLGIVTAKKLLQAVGRTL